MKHIIRTYLIHLLAIWFLIAINNGFIVSGNWQVVAYAALLLTAINTFLKPVIKLLFLPINMITLGFFSWVMNIIVLYLLILIVPQMKIEAWNFPGTAGVLFTLPAFKISKVANFIVSGIILAIVIRILKWISN